MTKTGMTAGQDNGPGSARQQSTREKDLELKIQRLEKERKDFKFDIQKKQDEIDQKNKKIKELDLHVTELKQYHGGKQSNYNSNQSNGMSEMQIK